MLVIHQAWKSGVCYWSINVPNNISRQYQRRSWNSVELSRWSSFTKIINDRKPLINFAIAFEPLFSKCLKSVLQDALEIFFQNILCSTRRDVFKTAIEDVFQIYKSDIFEASKRHLRLKCFQGVIYDCLENHLAKTSKNCLFEMSFLLLYEMSFRQLQKISSRFANPKSFRCLKDILPRCLERLHQAFLRCL